jgi:RNA polymerase sigma-70 factor (ECF subfamily)
VKKKELLEGLLAGNIEYLDELYKRYHDTLNKFVRKIMPRAEEDQIQQVMLQVLRLVRNARDKFDNQWYDRFTVWLYKVAQNVMMREKEAMIKDAVKLPKVSIDELSQEYESTFDIKSATKSPSSIMIRDEIIQMMQDKIMKLRPIYQEVIKLRWYERLSSKQIAHKLSVSEHAVKQRLKKAYQMLRSDLEDTFTTLARVYRSKKIPGD